MASVAPLLDPDVDDDSGRPSPLRSPGIAVRAIRSTGLTKMYGGVRAVDGLDLDVPRGSITGFVGPNGAGKTTTIRMLLGLIRPSGGSAEVLGEDVSNPAAYLSRVGSLIEGPAFHPALSGRRNLEVLASLGGYTRGRVDEVLEIVDLTDRARDQYRRYSLGMKQRLGVAAALLPDPELIVLDEPSNGLDPAGIIAMRSLLRSLRERGTTVFVSSHLLGEVEQLADWLVVLDHGRLLFQGPIADLLARRQTRL
ncbi:MAG TPA: ABC transporter ATP-binding protein, partial [Candidatus Dormibacteraeota bacterium]